MQSAQLQPDNPWPTWFTAVVDPSTDRAIRDLYAALDDAVAARGPTCWISGKCCNFQGYGHRLYVTGLEIAWFLEQQRQSGAPLTHPDDAETHGACPYQINKLCTTHSTRPTGCRVFFCQHGTEDWQQQLYEHYLNELRALHERIDVPYRYMDWLAGLDEGMGALNWSLIED